MKINNIKLNFKKLTSKSKPNYLNVIFSITLVLLLGCIQSCEERSSVDSKHVEPISETTDSTPIEPNILFWTQSQRKERFRKIKDFAPTTSIQTGNSVRELSKGTPLNINLSIDGEPLSIDDYMAAEYNNTIGMVILHNGKIRLEKYRSAANNDTHWISFSVTKSMTSTLVGAAIADGYIQSIEDPITQYIPELIGSGYDGVLIRHVLSMTSGVKWNEDYTDPEADVSKMQSVELVKDENPTVTYMKTLIRDVEPGSRWNYNTGETNLIGVLVSNATEKTLAAYLSEKIWKPFGMEQEASWILNAGVSEYGGCCISTSVRDFARFGQFALEEMAAGDDRILPKGWFASAGTKQADIGQEGRGYGYQWWTYDDGSFGASGIFGQGIFIDPSRNLVIATNSNAPTAVGATFTSARIQFYQAVQQAIDDE